MNSRLKDIDKFVNSIKTEEEHQLEKQNKFNEYKNKFKEKLNGYVEILNLEELYSLKSAGYIRYINLKGEIRYGGILIKVFKTESEDEFNKKNLLLLKNSHEKKWSISWEKNFIFYKHQTKKGDNLRNIFISLLDEKIE
jgi:hypothetical protein